MSKFKVGDKVRVLQTDYSEIQVGEIKEAVVVIKGKGVYLPSSDGDTLYFYNSEVEPYIESKKEENSDITKDLKKAIGFLDLHDKDQFMLDNIVATLEDRINEIRSS